ncbi:MAG: polysaccharide deacetylase family protein [Pseudomonadota bacterium]
MKFIPLLSASLLLLACSDSVSQEQQDTSIAVLQYHHVSDSTPAVTSISPKQFARHLDYLVDNNFQVLSITEAHQRIEQGRSFPDKAVVITFDDGYQNVYHNAAELLQQRNMPYAVFVNPDLMASSPSAYMSWEQLRDLQQGGATIVNHGQTHDHLIRRQAGETEAQWQQRMHYDIVTAQQAIDDKLGQQPKYFAYPFGEYDPSLQQLLKQWGFLGFAQHSGAWSPYSQETAITRFPASGRYANLETLATKLNSRALPVTDYQPQDPLLEHQQTNPTLTVSLDNSDSFQRQALQCFSGGDVLKPEWQSDTEFHVTPSSELPIGRSRINCTAPATAGNPYYWFSAAFIRPDEAGRWPD